MSQELRYHSTGFDFRFAFGPEKLPRLSRNGSLVGHTVCLVVPNIINI